MNAFKIAGARFPEGIITLTGHNNVTLSFPVDEFYRVYDRVAEAGYSRIWFKFRPGVGARRPESLTINLSAREVLSRIRAYKIARGLWQASNLHKEQCKPPVSVTHTQDNRCELEAFYRRKAGL